MPKTDQLLPSRIATAADLSADYTSTPTGVTYQDNIVYQCNLTGAPVGTLWVQGSVDYRPVPDSASENQPANAGNWVNIVSADITAADEVIFDLNQLPVPWVRLFYDFTSGTGAMDALVAGKKV